MKAGITPVIIITDNLLKVNKLIDLNSVDFVQGRPDEYPSFTFTSLHYKKLLSANIKFVVESDVNPDLENLVTSVTHDFGKIKWFIPKSQFEPKLWSVKLKLGKKVMYCDVSLSDLPSVAVDGWKIVQLSGGKLSKKQAERMKLIYVEGRFSYYTTTE